MKYLLFVAVLFLCYFQLKADHRSFVWTYEYMVMEPGSAEIEQYTTFASSDIDEFEGNTSTELNFEVEVGMNKHYDFAVYQNFKQGTDGVLKYSGYKLRTRYLIGEKNQYLLDPLIYLEYKGKPDFSEHEIEAKLILEKDFGDLRLSMNPYFELEFSEDETEFIPKYAIGASYSFGKLFSLGIESKGDKNGYYIGPTISHGTRNLWVALGSLYGVGNIADGKPEFQIRMIVGIYI